MPNPTRIEINCETGEVLEIELTTDEIIANGVAAEQAEAKRLEREVEAERIAALKVSARAKLVAGQALTEEEAATIVL